MTSLQSARQLGSETVKGGDRTYGVRKRWKLNTIGTPNQQITSPAAYLQWGTVVYSDDESLHLTLPTQQQFVVPEDGLYDIRVHLFATENATNEGRRDVTVYIDNNFAVTSDAHYHYPHNPAAGTIYSQYKMAGKQFLRAGQTIGVELSASLIAGVVPLIGPTEENFIEITLLA